MGIRFDKVISDKSEMRINRKLSGSRSVQFYKTALIFVILPFYLVQPVSPNRSPLGFRSYQCAEVTHLGLVYQKHFIEHISKTSIIFECTEYLINDLYYFLCNFENEIFSKFDIFYHLIDQL